MDYVCFLTHTPHHKVALWTKIPCFARCLQENYITPNFGLSVLLCVEWPGTRCPLTNAKSPSKLKMLHLIVFPSFSILQSIGRVTSQIECTTLLNTFYRAALRYAVHDSLVTAAFSALFLLKMANLFPTELDIAAIARQVEQLAQLLSDVAAER
jgi:hypothetical protein